MNLGDAIIDYRKDILRYKNTSSEELKKDMDLFSNKLITLFVNMDIDYYCLKEAGRKNGQWMFPDSKISVLFTLFGQLLDKESAAGMVIVGKAKDIYLNDLLELVELCLDLLLGAGISSEEIDMRREKVYKRLDIPLLEVKQEIYGLENVLDVSFHNEGDSLPVELHMKYQQFFSEQIRNLKIEAALVYLSMNQEYEYYKLREEASELKLIEGRKEYEEKSKEVGEILKKEFPELNVSDKEQMEAYARRRKELMKISNSKFIDYIEYMTQQAKIEKLCGESQEYCEQVDVLNKILGKAVNFDTKVRNYVKEEKRLYDIREKIIEEKLGEKELKCPEVISDSFAHEDSFDLDELFDKSMKLVSSMVKYNKNLKDTMLFEMSEQLFGQLL